MILVNNLFSLASLRRGTAAVIFLIGWLQQISTQTISIAGGTPVEGSPYQLDCVILGIEIGNTHALAWSKDGRILIWTQGTSDIHVDVTGDFTSTEYSDVNGNYHFILTITQVRRDHNGYYKCFIADGDLMNFNELNSASREIQITPSIIPTGNVMITPSAPQLYFPGSEWPVCYPENNVRALINTDITIRCESTPGNPVVSINLFSDGIVVSESNLNATKDLIERIYTFTLMPQDNDRLFVCQITGQESFAGMHRSCNIGEIQVGLFQETVVHAQENGFAIFNCIAGYQTAIHWSTDPPIPSSQLNTLDSAPNLLTITNAQMVDNGTLVICSVEEYNLRDQAQLIVIPRDDAAIQTTTEIRTTSRASISQGATSKSIEHTFEFINTSPATDKINNSMNTFNVAVVGWGVGLLMVGFVLGILGSLLCYRRLSFGKTKDKNLSVESKEPPTGQDLYTGLELQDVNVEDYTVLQDSNRHLKYKNPGQVMNFPSDANDSYTELELAGMHRSEYASLNVGPKLQSKDKSSRVYVNVDQKKEIATYENQPFCNTNATYVNVRDPR